MDAMGVVQSVERKKRASETEDSRDEKRLCTESVSSVSNFHITDQRLGVFDSMIISKVAVPEKFLDIERTLAKRLTEINYSQPVTHVYNPIEYARTVHSNFVNKFCESEKTVMFLGMNPGPWGMSQTGIPFGDVNIVKDWLGISGEIGRPKRENPARPILGFACKRGEISGQRFWSLFKELCGEAKCFFEHTLVYNHCPLAFMTESGKNITPSELKLEERKAVTTLCDQALCEVIELFHTSIIIAIGRYAEKRAFTVLKACTIRDVRVICIPHPSPRNFGNAGKWKEIVTEELRKHLLMDYFRNLCPAPVEENDESSIDQEMKLGVGWPGVSHHSRVHD